MSIPEGRIIRTIVGMVVVLADITVMVSGHVIPTVNSIKASICSIPGFTMEELYLHGGMMLTGILLIHPQSVRELPALIGSLVPFRRGT